MINIALLGSTGSVGRQTLSIVEEMPEQFKVVALAAGRNLEVLRRQVQRHRPRLVSLDADVEPSGLEGSEIVRGQEGLIAAATITDADIVVVATSGHAAILPTLRAIQLEKTIALANKEAVVCAGEIIMREARARGVEIRPVDSEHSAVWQCLGAQTAGRDVARVTLTASGGPFLDTPLEQIEDVTVDQALAHPNWSMGSKITIDSATMMNKGLEVIEAHWLFDLPYDRIDVVIHPQSLVHSFVSFVDGAVLAQMAVHDMRVPIQYALTYPNRAQAPDRALDLLSLGRLDFLRPDDARYPALALARAAAEAGSTYPTVLSSADEVAVAAFLHGAIAFQDIARIVDRVLERHEPTSGPLTLEAIAESDAWACVAAGEAIAQLDRRSGRPAGQ